MSTLHVEHICLLVDCFRLGSHELFGATIILAKLGLGEEFIALHVRDTEEIRTFTEQCLAVEFFDDTDVLLQSVVLEHRDDVFIGLAICNFDVRRRPSPTEDSSKRLLRTSQFRHLDLASRSESKQCIEEHVAFLRETFNDKLGFSLNRLHLGLRLTLRAIDGRLCLANRHEEGDCFRDGMRNESERLLDTSDSHCNFSYVDCPRKNFVTDVTDITLLPCKEYVKLSSKVDK